MANVYVRSGAGGAATGADWANAYLTLAAALSAKAAGDVFFVSEDHAETQASSITLTSPGIVSNPCFIYCVNHSGSVPPVSADLRTTATISATGASDINFSGNGYYNGVIFKASSGAVSRFLTIYSSATNSGVLRFDNCAFQILGTSGGEVDLGISGSNTEYQVIFNNTTIQFGSTAAKMLLRGGRFIWTNTPSAIQGATFPTTLFPANASTGGGLISLQGVDLSALGSGKTIVGAIESAQVISLQDCKLGSSVTVAATPAGSGGVRTDLIRCDSAGTNYRTERYRYEGTETVETTIVRTGGATDGTTPIAKKLVTTANSKWALPFEAIPIAIWNDSTSSITVTVYGISAGALNNDDIWMDVEYLGAAGNPQGSFATTTKADGLATGSALTSDSSTWGGSTTKFLMSATFTPAQKGAIYIYVKAAKASTTFYIDPKPEISGVTVSRSHILAPGVYANELQSAGAGTAGGIRYAGRGGFAAGV